MCHDIGQVEPFPADHEGLTNEVCLTCHEVAEGVEESAEGAAEMLLVPHSLEGREDCLVCHDIGQVEPFPADHEGRTNETCLTCHEVAEGAEESTEEAAAMLSVPHPVEGREDCLMCHDIGQVEPFPADHEGRTNETCLTCHEVAVEETP
jgi:hypothetical protein